MSENAIAYLSFTKFTSNYKQQAEDTQKCPIIVSIINQNYKEGVTFKTQISTQAKQQKAISKNLLILPVDEKLLIRIDERIRNAFSSFHKRVSIDHELHLWKKFDQKNMGKTKHEALSLETRQWTFTLEYDRKDEDRFAYAGQFMNCLQNQGDSTEESQESPSKKSNTVFDLKNEKKFAETIETQQFQRQIDFNEFDQSIPEAPKAFTARTMTEAYSSSKWSQESSKEGKAKRNQVTTLAAIHEEIDQNEQKQQSGQRRSKKKKIQMVSAVIFYKGPCKRKNIFSCCDEPVQEQQICFVEPYYKKNDFFVL